MLSMGLLEEARKLYEAGGEQWQSGKGIGYRELFPYFKDDISKASAIEKKSNRILGTTPNGS